MDETTIGGPTDLESTLECSNHRPTVNSHNDLLRDGAVQPRYTVSKFTAMGSPCEIALYSLSHSPNLPLLTKPASQKNVEKESQTRQLLEKKTKIPVASPASVPVNATSTLSESEMEAVISEARSTLERLELRYSRYLDHSLVARINQAAGTPKATPIDDETYHLLNYAEELFQQSEGLFDITSGALRKIWDFRRGHTPSSLPSRQLINQSLQAVGWPKVRFNERAISLPVPGMALDFGGIVKEYAVDAIAKLLYQRGVDSGIIDFGGDIRVLGPQPNRRAWPIGIRDPLQPDHVLKTLYLKSGAVATSGTYERFVNIDGVKYSHLLDPRTGWPVVNPLVSATVLADHAVLAGSIASIALLKGANQGLAWLENLGVPYVVVMPSGETYSRFLN